MFDRLSQRLKEAFKNVERSGVLNEAQVEEALKEVRRSLLEADVHFKVAKDLCETVKQRAIGAQVWKSLSPSQQVIQIFQEELIQILGGKEDLKIEFAAKPPVIILVCGLQGSGKTTFCGKLALYLTKKQKKSVGLLPADTQRPAAKTQLQVLGSKVSVPVFDSPLERGAVEVVKQGRAWAEKEFFDILIVDTAGRQQIDEELMAELSNIQKEIPNAFKLLVLDSMIGSQGLEVAKTFHEKVSLTGLVLTKLDGDARGGVALSARQVTGVPIYFASLGEKVEEMEVFHPPRMANRILGMGDVLTLIEKAQENISQDEAMESAQKMFGGSFTLEDFKNQLKMMKRMGPLEGIMKLVPGMSGAMDKLEEAKAQGFDPEREMKRVEAIINSMTPKERRNPDLLNGSRRLRIANGSGTTVAEINRLMKQFQEMQKMMKQLSKMGLGKGMFGKGGFPKLFR